ncbi:hypothetical protein BRD15_00765 [Halobacteriales archaeon SW_6_65_15]|nr:MAG: hypothetical protein BRD15_00765 [Halobacteriales archaeon SW_6_65_15]
MPQRSDQRTSDSVADDFTDVLGDDSAASESQSPTSSSPSVVQRLQHRAFSIFSPRIFLYALLLLGTGMLVGNFFVPLPIFDKIVRADESTHAVASRLRDLDRGAFAAGLTAVLGHFALTAFGDGGTQLAMFGMGTGLLAGALGAYFGGDLRNGLTADV